MCELCGRAWSKEVHHLIPLREAPELALDPDNVQALCKPCHARESQREATEARSSGDRGGDQTSE